MSTILRFANEGWRGMFFSAGRRAACRVEHLERSGARRASASAAVAFGLLEAGSWSESGRFCHRTGGHLGGDARVLMLTIL